MTNKKAVPGGTGILAVATILHAAAALALFPAVQAQITALIGHSPLPLLLVGLPPVTCMAVYVRVRMRRDASYFAKQMAGGTIGMFASFFALAVLIVWEIDLTSAPLFAFSRDAESFDGVVWFALFGVGMPLMLGVLLDGAVFRVARIVFAPLLRLRGILAAPVVLIFGIGIGAAAVAVFESRAVEEQVEAAQSSYWETLGEGWGLLVPIVAGVVFAIALSVRRAS